MPCGKKTPVKNWDTPKNLRTIKQSKYEKIDSTVKKHWKNVINDLELSYKDDKFWESQGDTVHELVGHKIFNRLVKMFDLPLERAELKHCSDVSIQPSEHYYTSKSAVGGQFQSVFSMSDVDINDEEESEEEEEEIEKEEQSEKNSLSIETDEKIPRQSKSKVKSKSQLFNQRLSRMVSAKSFSKGASRMTLKFLMSKTMKSELSSVDETAKSDDDLDVHPATKNRYRRPQKNPFFNMLYCSESETDMIKWNSNYKQKKFEVSASDEFSKKSEIKTKEICHDFYKWWEDLGSVEFRSEIKRPEDIEDLFQVWFDEHASRGLVLDPKILPCVLKSVAQYVGVPKASCPRVLQRQVAFDIRAETSPAHTTAFDTCLPQHLKHVPPKNNTKGLWDHVKIPEDLRTMSYVFDDIMHLTSTKKFHKWVKQRNYLPMPPVLQDLDELQDKKQLFVVPSDFIFRDQAESMHSTHDLALPVSQFTMELKEVLQKVMED